MGFTTTVGAFHVSFCSKPKTFCKMRVPFGPNNIFLVFFGLNWHASIVAVGAKGYATFCAMHVPYGANNLFLLPFDLNFHASTVAVGAKEYATFCKMHEPFGPNNIFLVPFGLNLARAAFAPALARTTSAPNPRRPRFKDYLCHQSKPLPSRQGRARRARPGVGPKGLWGWGDGVGWGGGVGLLKCAGLLVKNQTRRLPARSK